MSLFADQNRTAWRRKIDRCLQSKDQRKEILRRYSEDADFREEFYHNRSRWFLGQVAKIREHGACNLYFHSEVRNIGAEKQAGRHRVGKSYAALDVCHHFEPTFNVKRQVAFSAAQFQRVLRTIKPGHWVMYDEVNPRTGAGAGREQIEIPAWLEQGSATKTSTAVASPTIKWRYGINYFIELFGVCYLERYSMGFLSSAVGIGLGWLIFLLPPPPIVEAYEAVKQPHVKRFQAMAGAADTMHLDLAKALVADPRFAECRSFRDAYSLVQGKWETLSAREVEQVARWAIRWEGPLIFNSAARTGKGSGSGPAPPPPSYQDGGFEFRVLKQEENPKVVPTMLLVYDELQQAGQLPPVKRFKPQHLEAFCSYYGSSDSLGIIAGQYRVTEQALRNTYSGGGWIATAAEEMCGYLAEYVAQRLYFPNFNHIGGETEPDLFHPDREDMVEVKLRTRRDSARPTFSMLCTKEQANPGKTLLLTMLCERLGGTPRTTVTFYTIHPTGAAPGEAAFDAQKTSRKLERKKAGPQFYA